jgi:hypothetical protein
MKKNVSLRKALGDRNLLGDALPGDSWAAWRVILIAAMGEELTSDEREIFGKFTGGRDHEPGEMVEMLLVVAGRRSGKSRALSVLSTYLACLCDWSEHLFIGEVGTALYQAPTQRQAAAAFKYATDLIDHVDLLQQTIENRTQDCLSLRRSIELTAQAANWRYSRGSTCVCCVLDETAFFHNAEVSANSDEDLLTALMPSLSTTGGPMLIASSPNTMEGVVFKLHAKHFGVAGDPKILVVQADSRALNPSLRQSVVDRAYQADPEKAEAEFGGQFREPLAGYLARELVERGVERGITERAMLPGVRYVAFVDCASGTGTDSFACCIGHKARDADRDVCVIDFLIAQKPPFDPYACTAALAEHLKHWRINTVMGDNWAGGFPISAFAKHGITYQTCPLSASELYLHSLPAWTSATVAMLDNPRAIDELTGLRRKVGQAGKEHVVHMRGAHDDLANVVAGVIYRLTPIQQTMGDFGGFGVVAQPRLYPGDSSADTMVAWLATQNRNSFYAPAAGERSIHNGRPDGTDNALW